ncbi:MAG: xanthine dehydrogenase family protein subunit M [Verrucomicrobiota bacterium]
MKPFEYIRAKTAGDAVKTLESRPQGRFLAGGTNLLDLMKDEILSATDLVDLTRLDLTEIRATETGLSLGALMKNADTANHPLVRKNYPLLSRAILAAATVQIRNMATNGGNLLQRTRCPYFYDTATPCNKRAPGSGCGALEGLNRTHAIFGWSEKCVAVHPSDMAVALAALDAGVRVSGPAGERVIPISEFHRLPGDTPERDTNLERGELIVAIELPKSEFTEHYYYLKVRDRASYAFALVSVAVALDLDGDTIKEARIAMGGVAHKPWRAAKAEQFLTGKPASSANFEAAADAEMAGAKPLEHNAYKVELGRRAIVRALEQAAKPA